VGEPVTTAERVAVPPVDTRRSAPALMPAIFGATTAPAPPLVTPPLSTPEESIEPDTWVPLPPAIVTGPVPVPRLTTVTGTPSLVAEPAELVARKL